MSDYDPKTYSCKGCFAQISWIGSMYCETCRIEMAMEKQRQTMVEIAEQQRIAANNNWHQSSYDRPYDDDDDDSICTVPGPRRGWPERPIGPISQISQPAANRNIQKDSPHVQPNPKKQDSNESWWEFVGCIFLLVTVCLWPLWVGVAMIWFLFFAF